MKGLHTYFIFLRRNPSFAFVNLFGLTTAFVFVLLIANMVTRQLTADRKLKDVERIYVLSNEHYAASHYLVGERLASRYPDIEDWCGVNTEGMDNLIYATYQDKKTRVRLHAVKENFFRFFSFRLFHGNPDQVLADRYSIVLTESGARRLFGNEDPVGKTLQLSGGKQPVYTVTGIVEDMDRSLFSAETDGFVPFDMVDYINYGSSRNNPQMNNAGGTMIFARFAKGCDPNAKNKDLLNFQKSFFWLYQFNYMEKALWIPMRELYFSEILAPNMEQYSLTKVVIFGVSGLLILLMAIFNYLSMSVAQISFRAKEMATRRLLGSSQTAIFWRMMGEALLMVAAALGLAFLIALAIEPQVDKIFHTRTDLYGDLGPLTLGSYLAVAVAVAFLAGFVPASLLVRYKPIDIVKGNLRRKTKSVYLRALYVLQTGLTLAMLCCSIYLGRKVYCVLHEPLGYSYGQVLDYPRTGTLQQMRLFRSEALKRPFVKYVCFTQGTPNSRGNNNSMQAYTGQDDLKNISFQVFRTDTVFAHIFRIPVQRKERATGHGETYLFSESTFRELALKPEEVTEIRTQDDAFPVNGYFGDLKFGSILDIQSPHLISEMPADSIRPWNILVEVQGNDPEACRKELDRLYARITEGIPFDSAWYADEVKETYRDIIGMQQLLFGFTAAAFIISLSGLTAMSLYFISQRKRDMAVRKVFGSTQQKEMMRLMKFVLVSLGMALVMALPLISIGVRLIDRAVNFRNGMEGWILPVAFLTVALLSLASIWLISRQAVRENPVDHLKTE